MSITLFDATPASDEYEYETEYIGEIMSVCAGEKMTARLCVLNYEVDLYFPDTRLAVECNTSKPNARRQAEIESALGCRFINFNPNSRDFDFCRVLARIQRVVAPWKSEKGVLQKEITFQKALRRNS